MSVLVGATPTDMPGAMAEYGKEYKRKQCTKGADKGRTISNVLLAEAAEGWLPAAIGVTEGEGKTK
ncbi:hypothetical protein BV923_23285 [Pectobacterium odoriferum]|nr:hypothetical protein BV923_23285 [Pectobacterium odoriferum]